MKQGRPANRQSATLYDWRRMKALVDVLAHSQGDTSIRELCEQWGVEPVEDRSFPAYRGVYYLNVWATLRNLARYVLEHGRAQSGAGQGE